MTIYKLGEIAKIVGGNSKFTEKYILNNQGIYSVISSKTSNNGIYGCINTFQYEKGITISKDGVYAGTIFYQEKPFSITSHAFYLEITNKNVLEKYLFYFLKNKQEHIQSITYGSTRDSLTKTDFSDFVVSIPSLETQSAIIKIIEPKEDLFFRHKNLVRIDSEENTKKDLSILIKIIEPLEKQINAFDELIFSEQKSLQHYLNYFLNKLASINPSIFKNYKLGDITKIVSGNPKFTKSYIEKNEGVYPVISSSSFNNGVYGYINTFDYEKGITISKDGSVGNIFYQSNCFSINASAMLIQPVENMILEKYLFYLLRSKEKNIKQVFSGSVIKHIYPRDIVKIKVDLPTLKTQSAILGIIEPLHKKINLLKQKKKLLEKRFIYYQNHLIKEKIKDE
ncbi:RESTRICTION MODIFICATION ENZYME SUBUNIT S2A [Mycoplasmopsis pulmonis]|uniref:RESTRICTION MODIFICATION ENZYME SUBUNIT S2A n=1 Tax=Mycoplasmopsis pulmonis (strain UAB CTIP) TaxID=272635 RepID=Q98QD5_MYCPU|nr:restriction endonuclease subunit S [Mycoplasmopsis pulmonis]CAC13604.1 RESTRICTION MODIFICATION ENZYME SUBUNIT S2A [Mycoplasmopsis pulmonis]